LFDENRIRDSSGEKEAPVMLTVSMNCSKEYCFFGRWTVWVETGAVERARMSAATDSETGRRWFIGCFMDDMIRAWRAAGSRAGRKAGTGVRG
jgi:hypothetical protein